MSYETSTLRKGKECDKRDLLHVSVSYFSDLKHCNLASLTSKQFTEIQYFFDIAKLLTHKTKKAMYARNKHCFLFI